MQIFIKSFWSLLRGLLTFLIVIVNSLCLAQTPDEIYTKKLNEVILKIQNDTQTHVHEILEIMPVTSNEAIVFYGYDYDDRTSKAFQTLNALIVEKAHSNSEILSQYLKMSQFVDGYFAEDYFDNIEAIARKNNEAFCKLYNNLDPKYVSRLADVFKNHCR